MWDDLKRQLEAATQHLLRQQEAAEKIKIRLAESRFTATSADGGVEAIVAGDGRLLGLRLSAQSQRQAHPQQLGPAIVAAVNEARQRASERSAREWNTLLADRATVEDLAAEGTRP